MSHKLRSRKPFTRGKQYDYVKMSKGIPLKDDDSDVSQKVLDEEDTLIGAEGVAPHPYEAPGSFDEEELDYEEEVETSQPDVTLDKVYSFPGLSVDTALAREEENNRKIRAEIEALRKQEALLEKRVEADNLRKQLAEQKARVASHRGNVSENESRSKSRDSA